MGEEGIKPTADQIADMRNRLKDYIASNGGGTHDVVIKSVGTLVKVRFSIPPGEFDTRDVDRFMQDNFYVERFFMHVESVAGNDQVGVAMNMVFNTLRFRNDNKMIGERK